MSLEDLKKYIGKQVEIRMHPPIRDVKGYITKINRRKIIISDVCPYREPYIFLRYSLPPQKRKLKVRNILKIIPLVDR